MSSQNDLETNAFLLAHMSILFWTYQALDDETRGHLLRVLRKEAGENQTEFFLQHLPRVDGPIPHYRATLKATPRQFREVFFQKMNLILSDLAEPRKFGPFPPGGPVGSGGSSHPHSPSRCS